MWLVMCDISESLTVSRKVRAATKMVFNNSVFVICSLDCTRHNKSDVYSLDL